MSSFMDKAKEFAAEHDEQVDEGIEKAGEQVDRRTGGKHTEQVDKAVRFAQEHTPDKQEHTSDKNAR